MLNAARSAVVLEPPADRLVHALKYGGWRELSIPMVRRMAALRLPDPERRSGTVVVPVPTTRARRRRRGYNQAAVLARALSEMLERPFRSALRRRRAGRTQVALQPLERGRNVRRAFALRDRSARRLAGRSVLLVDDVLTTGATAAAAARTLGRAGVADVTVVTFARALPFRSGAGR